MATLVNIVTDRKTALEADRALLISQVAPVMATLDNIVTDRKTALEADRALLISQGLARLAELDADIARCDAVLTALGSDPAIEATVLDIGRAELLPTVARDLTL
jgi:3-hydroxyisobutyrate dehydrogenase-like beta-hydroxyacid dehydrogenase